jgi:predicted TIM-barrel fold metal-dependent hydrolase
MIIDCDTHIMPRSAFDRLPREFDRVRPQLSIAADGAYVALDFPGYPPPIVGATPLGAPGNGARYPGMTDLEARLQQMDEMGIDIQVLVPQIHGWWSYLVEPDLASAIAVSYNAAIAEIVAVHPDRLWGGALVALQDVEKAIEQMEDAARSGFRCVVIDKVFPVPTHCFSEPLGNCRELWPFFARAEALDMAVLLHAVPHGHRTTNLLVYQHNGLDVLAPAESHLSLASLVTSGLLDDFPDLRIVFTEGGTAFIRPLVERLDAAFEQTPVDYDAEDGAAVFNMRRLTFGKRVVPIKEYRAKNRRAPSSYFRRNIFFTIETEEPGFDDAVRFLGGSQFLFATDYPHDDPGGKMKFLDVKLLHDNQAIPYADKEAMRSVNPLKVFRPPRST